MIRQERWVNTNPGHNKDYIITFDDVTFDLTSEWGVIGGARRTAHRKLSSITELMSEVGGKRDRRSRGGYSLVSSDIWDPAVGAYAPAAAPRRRSFGVADFKQDAKELV